MALTSAAILDCTVWRRHEFPLISFGHQSQLQYAVLAVEACLAIRFGSHELVVRIDTTGADHEFADTAGGIGAPVAGLRAESFVEVIVAVQHDLRAGVVKNVENCPHAAIGAVLSR